MRVVTRTRPFSAMFSFSASSGCSQSGCRWLISDSHLLLAERVWMSVGMRNVGSRMRFLGEHLAVVLVHADRLARVFL